MTLSIPTTSDGTKMLPLPSLEDPYLRKLFEHATYGLYRHRLGPQGWGVSPGTPQYWQIDNESAGIGAILPTMKLDIILESPRTHGQARRIVVDTKYTALTKPGYYRDATLDSGHIYQLYAYLMSQDRPSQLPKSEGLLLHPSVGEHIDEEAFIQGHRIRSATVDLTAKPHQFTDSFIAALSAAK